MAWTVSKTCFFFYKPAWKLINCINKTSYTDTSHYFLDEVIKCGIYGVQSCDWLLQLLFIFHRHETCYTRHYAQFLTSAARFWMCSTSAGTLRMCIRNIVINFSEKPEDARGRRASVNTAEIDTCFNVILALPSPLRSRDWNTETRLRTSLHSHFS